MKIITLTLNPAFDIHCRAPHFEPCRENLFEITERDAGGKGVNISRALHALGRKNKALVVLGRENADDFATCLEKDKLSMISVTVPGRIRENITLHVEDAEETRISFRGFSATSEILPRVFDMVSAELSGGDVVTVTGSMPSGLSMAEVKEFVGRLSALGVRIVIDSRSFSPSDLIETRPWLIKPNREEISAYLGREVNDIFAAAAAAAELHGGGIENVMISLGEWGALLACREGVYHAVPPSVRVLSTIGAGDSSIAGFLDASACGLPPERCLAHAVATGTAACLVRGTGAPTAHDIADILGKVRVEKI